MLNEREPNTKSSIRVSGDDRRVSCYRGNGPIRDGIARGCIVAGARGPEKFLSSLSGCKDLTVCGNDLGNGGRDSA